MKTIGQKIYDMLWRTDSDTTEHIVLYHNYVNQVYHYFFLRVGNAQEAQDLAMQTFTTAFHEISDLTPHQGNLTIEVFGIAQCKLANYLQAKQFAPPTPDTELSPRKFPDTLNYQLMVEQITALLQTLPAEQADAFALRIFGRLHEAEVGQIIDKSSTAVNRLVYRAVCGLTRQLTSPVGRKTDQNEHEAAKELAVFVDTPQNEQRFSNLSPEEAALIRNLVALVETVQLSSTFIKTLEIQLARAQTQGVSFYVSADFKGEEMSWENTYSSDRLLNLVNQVSQNVISRPWHWLMSERRRLQRQSPLAALAVDISVLILVGAGLWFIAQVIVTQSLSSTPPAATPQTKTTVPSRVRLIYDSTTFCPSKPIDLEAIQQFVNTTPNIEIGRRCLSSFFYRIQKDLASPNPPNLSKLFAGFNVRSLASKGLLLDISDLWEQEGWSETYPQWLQEQSTVDSREHLVFVNPQEPPLKLQIAGIEDGRKYFLPVAYSWFAIYYSKIIFERYNLAPPKTWNEFLTLSETLKKNGITPLAISEEMTWFDYLNIRLNGPDFHRDLLNGQTSYNDARVELVFEVWQEFLNKEYFYTETRFESFGYSQAILAMHREEAAMALGDSFLIREAIPKKFQDNFGFFPVPVIDHTVPIGEIVTTFGYVIPTNAQNQEASRHLLVYLGSAEAQAYLANRSGLVPARTVTESDLLGLEAKQGQRLINNADTVISTYTSSTPRTMGRRGPRAVRLFLNKTYDLEEVLSIFEAARQEALSDS